jgi:hypothetical protein
MQKNRQNKYLVTTNTGLEVEIRNDDVFKTEGIQHRPRYDRDDEFIQHCGNNGKKG